MRQERPPVLKVAIALWTAHSERLRKGQLVRPQCVGMLRQYGRNIPTHYNLLSCT